MYQSTTQNSNSKHRSHFHQRNSSLPANMLSSRDDTNSFNQNTMILNTPIGTPMGVTYEEMRMTKEKWKQE